MGGHGSGRVSVDFGRNKPLAEDCVRLCVYELQRAGVFVDGSSGILQWDSNSCTFAYSHDMLVLAGRSVTNGGEGQAFTQRIRLTTIPLHWKHGTARRCFICPQCGHKCYMVYLAPRRRAYACRECCNLAYELQCHHNANLFYRYWKAIMEERRMERKYLKDKRLTVIPA
jgi:hypothetical protein